MKKIIQIAINFIPILIMIGLIPIIKNDYWLSAAFLIVVLVSFMVNRQKHEVKIFLFGLVMLTISEAIFVSTGVETFVRRSLFNLMPLWLPILWGYAFVAIKRSTLILNS